MPYSKRYINYSQTAVQRKIIWSSSCFLKCHICEYVAFLCYGSLMPACICTIINKHGWKILLWSSKSFTIVTTAMRKNDPLQVMSYWYDILDRLTLINWAIFTLSYILITMTYNSWSKVCGHSFVYFWSEVVFHGLGYRPLNSHLWEKLMLQRTIILRQYSNVLTV